MTEETLDLVFGPESAGDTPEERALSSQRSFVRSQDHLSLATPKATGHRLSAQEAFFAYGLEKLVECMEFGSAVLPFTRDEPARTLRSQREQLGLNIQTVARSAKTDATVVERAEDPSTRTPIDVLERIAIALGLDERLVGYSPSGDEERRLATRLRALSHSRPSFTQNAVATFAHAAWVIRTQNRLARQIGLRAIATFDPDRNYGGQDYPVWQHGYYLAGKTRDMLGLGRSPIRSLRELCSHLQVPVVLVTLPRAFAGATIQSADGRGIVVNTVGPNRNVWVRRATVAHELGHMLWDPEDRLESVRVDEYEDIGRGIGSALDYVEKRANAFMIELLVPSQEVERIYRSIGEPNLVLHQVMDEFGVSFTAARHHLSNVTAYDFGSLGVDEIGNIGATQEWQARESYTDDYFPIQETSQPRRGEFAGVVVAAVKAGVISHETAATYLETTTEVFEDVAEQIEDLFPVRGMM